MFESCRTHTVIISNFHMEHMTPIWGSKLICLIVAFVNARVIGDTSSNPWFVRKKLTTISSYIKNKKNND